MLRASRFCVTVSIALGWVAACGGRASSESGGSAGATIASAAAGADVGGTCGSSVGCGAGRSAIGEAGSPIGEAGAGGAALAGSSGMAGAGVASSESGGGSGGAPSGSGGSGGPAIAGSGGSTAGVGTNICCNGASCVYQASTSCPEVQGLPNLYLSTFSGPPSRATARLCKTGSSIGSPMCAPPSCSVDPLPKRLIASHRRPMTSNRLSNAFLTQSTTRHNCWQTARGMRRSSTLFRPRARHSVVVAEGRRNPRPTIPICASWSSTRLVHLRMGLWSTRTKTRALICWTIAHEYTISSKKIRITILWATYATTARGSRTRIKKTRPAPPLETPATALCLESKWDPAARVVHEGASEGRAPVAVVGERRWRD